MVFETAPIDEPVLEGDDRAVSETVDATTEPAIAAVSRAIQTLGSFEIFAVDHGRNCSARQSGPNLYFTCTRRPLALSLSDILADLRRQGRLALEWSITEVKLPGDESSGGESRIVFALGPAENGSAAPGRDVVRRDLYSLERNLPMAFVGHADKLLGDI